LKHNLKIVVFLASTAAVARLALPSFLSGLLTSRSLCHCLTFFFHVPSFERLNFWAREYPLQRTFLSRFFKLVLMYLESNSRVIKPSTILQLRFYHARKTKWGCLISKKLEKKIFFGMSDLKKNDDDAILTTRCIQKLKGPSLNEMAWMQRTRKTLSDLK